jgi:hypothetical protein
VDASATTQLVFLRKGEWLVNTPVYGPKAPKPRKVNFLSRRGSGLHYGVHNNTNQNAYRAVVERVFNYKLKRPTLPYGKLTAALKEFKTKLKNRLPKTVRLNWKQFCESYPSCRRKRYENAVESLKLVPVQAKDSFSSSFLKAEKVNFSEDLDKTPRLIQPRSPRYIVELGCFIKVIEHRVYQAIDRIFGERTIAKGMNADRRGRVIDRKWNSFLAPLGIGLDIHRYDQHVSVEALRFEHDVYMYCDDSPLLARLLKMQLHNVGFCRTNDGCVKYCVLGCRLSGDPNTALGNCLVVSAMVWSFCRHVGIKKFSLINDGDDCVLFIEKEDRHLLASLGEYFEKLGFHMKIAKEVDTLEEVVFCQSQPVRVGPDYRMVRQPKIALSKDLLTVKSMETEADWAFLSSAIGCCGLALCSGVPVMQAFYVFLDKGCRVKETNPTTGMEYLALGMRSHYSVVLPSTRASFYSAFGITPSYQVELEDYFHHCSHDYQSPVRTGWMQQTTNLLRTITSQRSSPPLIC